MVKSVYRLKGEVTAMTEEQWAAIVEKAAKQVLENLTEANRDRNAADERIERKRAQFKPVDLDALDPIDD